MNALIAMTITYCTGASAKNNAYMTIARFVLKGKNDSGKGGELDLKKRGTIIAVAAVALALLVSAGIAVAAGVSDGGAGRCAEGEGITRVAGDAFSFGCRNAGEESNIRAENCVGAENGACEGDCVQERLRERDCDGECDGDSTQSRKGWSDETPEEGAAAGPQARGAVQGGECAGDCDRTRDRLCDGSCDSTCDGDGAQNQDRGGS